MTHAELLAAMRADLGDEDGALFSDSTLARCLLRASGPVGEVTGQALLPVNGEIIPAPVGVAAELLLLLAESYACAVMRAKAANAVNIASGDKRIDRGGQAKAWAEMEADLLSRYQQRVTDLRGGELFATPPPLRPVLYEQGSEVMVYELTE